MDDSHLDLKYFIDKYKYNCPFCNRRHVSYRIPQRYAFDWSTAKTCRALFIKCESCHRTSMHLTYQDLTGGGWSGSTYRFSEEVAEAGIDSFIFYSVPTSFFVMDDRIRRAATRHAHRLLDDPRWGATSALPASAVRSCRAVLARAARAVSATHVGIQVVG